MSFLHFFTSVGVKVRMNITTDLMNAIVNGSTVVSLLTITQTKANSAAEELYIEINYIKLLKAKSLDNHSSKTALN